MPAGSISGTAVGAGWTVKSRKPIDALLSVKEEIDGVDSRNPWNSPGEDVEKLRTVDSIKVLLMSYTEMVGVPPPGTSLIVPPTPS